MRTCSSRVVLGGVGTLPCGIWHITSVLVKLIASPRLFAVVLKCTIITCKLALLLVTRTRSSVYSSVHTQKSLLFVLDFSLLKLKSLQSNLVLMYTLLHKLEGQSSSTAARYMKKRVGASTQPCLTPCATGND